MANRLCYARVVSRVRRRAIRDAVPAVLLLVVAPAAAIALASTRAVPWGLRVPVDLFMGAVLLVSVRDLFQMVCQDFGMKIVPRFARRLDADLQTYLHGTALRAHLPALDTRAHALGLTALSDFGICAGRAAFFPPREARRTIAALLRETGVPAVRAELRRIDAALALAEEEKVDFRFELVHEHGYNGELWRRLRDAGY